MRLRSTKLSNLPEEDSKKEQDTNSQTSEVICKSPTKVDNQSDLDDFLKALLKKDKNYKNCEFSEEESSSSSSSDSE